MPLYVDNVSHKFDVCSAFRSEVMIFYRHCLRDLVLLFNQSWLASCSAMRPSIARANG